MGGKIARAIAACGALTAGFALALQLAVLGRGMLADGASPLEVIWRFTGYFTILTNMLVFAIMARAALRPMARNGINTPTTETAGTAAILLVAIVYHLLLAHRWDPQGWQLLSDTLLHTIVPILCASFWLARPHGALKWRDALICMIWPLGYCLYALIRGAIDGWYAYPFLDASVQSLPELITSIASISGGFAIGALALVVVDRVLARGEAQRVS